MSSELIISTRTELITGDDALTLAGQAANRAASANVIEDYRIGCAKQTRRRQDGDLAMFERYLRSAGLYICDMASRPECWRGMTSGLIEAFKRWQLNEGYALGSINARLATVKVYSGLAYKAGVIDGDEYVRIKEVKGYNRKKGRHADESRTSTNTATRRTTNSKGSVSHKKAQPVIVTKQQTDALKRQPDTPQGRRDALLMCLLLDHGLRCGEVAILKVTDFDLKAGTFTFHRPKVDNDGKHRMTTDTIRAAAAYLSHDAPALGALLMGSKKNGELSGGLSDRAINHRVGVLGKLIGVDGLSPHDCRHYWATAAAEHGTPIDKLMNAGGWSSYAMPLRYINKSAIDNDGVKLD